MEIQKGDFIKSKGLAVFGFVISKGTLTKRDIPCYRVDMGDHEGVILESEAELLWPCDFPNEG